VCKRVWKYTYPLLLATQYIIAYNCDECYLNNYPDGQDNALNFINYLPGRLPGRSLWVLTYLVWYGYVTEKES
jgi:hypothetical protein